MEMRLNIILSAVLHGMVFIISALLVRGGFMSGMQVAPPLNVSFFEERAENAPRSSQTQKETRMVAQSSAVSVQKEKLKKSDADRNQKPEQRTLADSSAPEVSGAEPHPNTGSFEKIAHNVPSAAVSGEAQSGSSGSSLSLTQTTAVFLGSADGKGAVQRGASGATDVTVLIRSALERAKNYPPMAKKRGIQGTVTASFVINAQGFPEDVRIVKSSGYEVLDTAARSTVQKAAPFPVVQGIIEVPITFTLQ